MQYSMVKDSTHSGIPHSGSKAHKGGDKSLFFWEPYVYVV